MLLEKYLEGEEVSRDFVISKIKQLVKENDIEKASFEAMVHGPLIGGKVMTNILNMGGSFEEPEIFDNKMIISGEVPVATSMNYKLELLSSTSGKAIVNMQFVKFDICHNQEEVLKNQDNIIQKEDSIYNGVSLFREKKKMKKVIVYNI